MWANNVLFTTNAKPRRLFKKWHDRALLIDLRKTKLVIENDDSESAPVMEMEDEYCLGVQEFLHSHDANSIEEPTMLPARV